MTQQDLQNKQIKGITYKMLFGFLSVILSVITSAIFITISITDYKDGVRNDLKIIFDRSVYNREKIDGNRDRIIVLEGISNKHETEIQILKTKR